MRQPNAFVDAARNAAAKRSSAEFLLFVDADDVPAPHAIERLLAGIQRSGVDCLLSGGYLFDSDEGKVAYMPLGPDLTAGLVDPMVFGLPMILIRRTAFEAIGGYREWRGAGHEDWELQARLLTAGCTCDVLPEHLLFFRRSPDGLTNTGDTFLAKSRLISAYATPLREAGMTGLAAAIFHLNEQCTALQQKLKNNLPLDLRLALHRSQMRERP
jgi:GT2 family glycosyltransferase